MFVKNKDFGEKTVKLSEINPFVRFVHALRIDENEHFGLSTAFDNRLFYLRAGLGAIRIAGETLSLSVGDAVILPSGTAYELLPCALAAHYIAVNFDYTQSHVDKDTPIPPLFSGRFDPDLRFETIDFDDAEELCAPLCVRGVAGIAQKLLSMESEYGRKMLAYGRVLSASLSEILIECIRAHRALRFEKSGRIIGDILGFVEKNSQNPLTNADVAAAFGLHPNYVSQLMKLHTGLPLHRYLMHLRISRAMELLGKGGSTVGDVALQCGFVDIYHFSKTFKRLTGVPPSKYL